LALAVAVGCADHPARTPSASAESPRLAYAGLREAWNSPHPACGRRAVRPSAAVFITARQCLGCREIGHLLRKLSLRNGAADTGLTIVIPTADTTVVCEFLHEERIAMPVAAISAGPANDYARSSLIGYARRDSTGRIADSVVADDGRTLLALLHARGDMQ